MRSPQMIEARIGAPVFKDQSLAVAKRQDCRYGPLYVERDSNLQVFAKTIDQIAKPTGGLRRKLVAPPREHQQIPERAQKSVRLAFLVFQAFLQRPLNLSLCRTFV